MQAPALWIQLHPSLSSSVVSSTRCPRLILYVPWLSPEVSLFSMESRLTLVDLGTRCAPYCWGVIAPGASKLDRAGECVCRFLCLNLKNHEFMLILPIQPTATMTFRDFQLSSICMSLGDKPGSQIRITFIPLLNLTLHRGSFQNTTLEKQTHEMEFKIPAVWFCDVFEINQLCLSLLAFLFMDFPHTVDLNVF